MWAVWLRIGQGPIVQKMVFDVFLSVCQFGPHDGVRVWPACRAIFDGLPAAEESYKIPIPVGQGGQNRWIRPIRRVKQSKFSEALFLTNGTSREEIHRAFWRVVALPFRTPPERSTGNFRC